MDEISIDNMAFHLIAWYPQIYLACHVEHSRSKSSRFRVSAKDASILAHLDQSRPTKARSLAAHLQIAESTTSELIHRLESLGYLSRKRNLVDRRHIELYLTKLGRKAIEASSVLHPGRVKQLLEQLTSQEKQQALKGMELLAQAAQKLALPRIKEKSR